MRFGESEEEDKRRERRIEPLENKSFREEASDVALERDEEMGFKNGLFYFGRLHKI